MPPSNRILGIDLGTTNSCMAVIRDGEIQVLRNLEGERTTPSVVALFPDREALVGRSGKRMALARPRDTVHSVKRFIGRKADEPGVAEDARMVAFQVVPAANGDAWIRAAGKDWSPAEISALVLAKLKRDAESELGESLGQAVITVPAYFNDAQRQATKDAGAIAGLEVLRIVNEPTAAALSCGLDPGLNQNVVVYDLGGGTFDVTVLQARAGVFEVRATRGDTHLGGDDFDQAIMRLALEAFHAAEGVDLAGDPAAVQRLREAAEAAKIALTTETAAEINLPFICPGPNGPLHLVFPLTRERFNAATLHLARATLDPCDRALSDAGIAKGQVDALILVGGMTRVLEVRRLVEAHFGKTARSGVDPDEAVAVGAAIQGGILRGQVRDRLLLDVTPLSLGVRVSGGLFSRLIERNATVPCRKRAVYTTANDYQTSVRVSVYQGEHPLAADNMFLGDFELVDLPSAPKGEPKIEVSFDIDANGILKVRAKDLASGKAQQIKVQPNSGLDDAQLKGMIEEAKRRAGLAGKATEREQFRLTCKKLIEQCDFEIRGASVDQGAVSAWLREVAGHVESGAEDTLRTCLKELNQCVLRLRAARPAGDRPKA